MDFRILGPLEVLDEGRAVDLGGQKQRAVLAALLLDANHVVSSDRLIDVIWEGSPPASAPNALQGYVAQLRKALGRERVVTKAPGYLLTVEQDELDLDHFERLQAAGELESALALWRGAPLADLAYARFAQPEIARLQELRLACLEERVERDLGRGHHADLVGELEALVGEQPLRERLRGQLMLALYRSGRQAEALDVYQIGRAQLVDELGIEPGKPLRDLQQQIRRQDPALDPARGGAAASVASERGAFVGRESELAELCGGLDDAVAGRGRLFLLPGEPGIGKSRLAEELVVRARTRCARNGRRCWEAGGAPAYWPWVQAIRAFVRTTDPEVLRSQLGAERRRLCALAARLRGGRPPVRRRSRGARPGTPLGRDGALRPLARARGRGGEGRRHTGRKTAFLSAAEMARRLGLPRELARAAAGYGGRYMWGRAGGDARLVPLIEEGLSGLAEEDVELRARLLARLAGALRDEPTRHRRDRLSREAVELARRSRNPAALAYALDGRCSAIMAPDTVEEFYSLATELRGLCERNGDLDRVTNAIDHRRSAQLMLGDLDDAEIELEMEGGIADELGQPAQLWNVAAARAMFALVRGRLIEAEELVLQAFEFGERALPVTAIPVFRLQRYTLCDLRGTLEQTVPMLCDLAAEYPTRPAFRCVLAHVHARLALFPEAKATIDDLTRDDVAVLPFDQEWVYGMSLLAETSALLGDATSAAVLYRLLLPWAAFNAADHPEGFRGSVARYLGQLAATMERWSEAVQHFEDALRMNERIGARPWLAHAQADYAKMLGARGEPGDRGEAGQLLARALAIYRELGLERYAATTSEIATELV